MKKLLIATLAAVALCGCSTFKPDCDDCTDKTDCDDCYVRVKEKKPAVVKTAAEAVRPGNSYVTYTEYTNLVSRVEVIERAYARRQAAISALRKKKAEEAKKVNPYSVNPTAKAKVKNAAKKAPAAK